MKPARTKMGFAWLAILSLTACVVEERKPSYLVWDLLSYHGDIDYVEGAIWDLDGVPQMTLTPLENTSISATLTANTGTLEHEAVASGWNYLFFGVGGSCGPNWPFFLDECGGVHEAITITFNRDVILESVAVSSYVGIRDWQVQLTAPDYSTVFTYDDMDTDWGRMTVEVFVPARQPFVIEYVSGYGFSLDEFAASID